MKRHSVPTPSLLRQFVLLAGIVLAIGMVGTGIWISSQVKRVVIQNAGAVTALYVDAMITPVAQELEPPLSLGPVARGQLDGIVRQGALRHHVSAFKLWDASGRVVYSTRPELVGQIGRDNPRLDMALGGRVSASLRALPAVGSAPSEALMEVYSPVRSVRNGDVIGVAEFYTTSDTLRADMFRSTRNSWLVVGLATLGMFAALYTIFARGSRTIARQRRALDDKIAELSASLEQNAALTRQVAQANLRIAEINDLTLRRLSADLHDGPAQHLAFAALRLDGVEGQERVAEAVDAALRELRLICRGLVPPELRALGLPTIARRVIAAHETRTGASVGLEITGDVPELSLAARHCVHRFVQETLNNCARHAGGAEQRVTLRGLRDGVEVEVIDDGPGFDPEGETEGLGIIGLRERILGLKGRFELRRRSPRGTSVRMWLPPSQDGEAI